MSPRIEEAWRSAAGELAGESRVLSVARGLVKIAVRHQIVIAEMRFRQREIIADLRKRLPDLQIDGLVFRIVPNFSSIEPKGLTMTQTNTLPVPAASARAGAMLDPAVTAACQRLDGIALDYVNAIGQASGQLARAAILASGLHAIREAVTPEIVRCLAQLQGSKLGFETDKDDQGGYADAVLRDVLVEALLRGVYPVGNEFNVIAGGLYITRNGYERLLRDMPGLSDLEVIPGVPAMHNAQMCVRVSGRWKYHGVAGQLTDGEGKPGRVFPIRVNAKMGVDAIVGKSIRKACKAIYETILGSGFALPEPEDDPPTGQRPQNQEPPW